MAPLPQGYEQGDAPAVDDRVDVTRILDKSDLSRMHASDIPRHVDHFEAPPEGSFTDELLLGENRQNLEDDTTFTQPGQPVVAERVEHSALAAMKTGHQQVVMRICDQRGCTCRLAHTYDPMASVRPVGLPP